MTPSTDTELLDRLADRGNGDPWVARESTAGRGFRLHNISPVVADYAELAIFETPREALQQMVDWEDTLIPMKRDEG